MDHMEQVPAHDNSRKDRRTAASLSLKFGPCHHPQELSGDVNTNVLSSLPILRGEIQTDNTGTESKEMCVH